MGRSEYRTGKVRLALVYSCRDAGHSLWGQVLGGTCPLGV